MGRLRAIGPRLASAKPRLAVLGETERGTRAKDQPGAAFYKLARWKSPKHGLRMQCLLRDLFTCRMCGRVEHDSAKLVADHKVPHRGDPDLFWNLGNLQCLCKPCHDGRKQRDDKRGR